VLLVVQVKDCLSPDEYKIFQATLRDFRSKQIELAELMERVQQLFGGEQRYELLRDFVAFVPPRHKATYLAMLPGTLLYTACFEDHYVDTRVFHFAAKEEDKGIPRPAVAEEPLERASTARSAQSPLHPERVQPSSTSYDLVSGSPCKPFRRPRPFVSPLLPTAHNTATPTTTSVGVKTEDSEDLATETGKPSPSDQPSSASTSQIFTPTWSYLDD
jgi:histone deacetylase complex regulatory component SIN3